MPDNKDLLQQLRLDKTSAPPPNIHFGWWLAAAVVTVVRAQANSRGLLQRMRDALRQVRAEHLGVVLNAVRAQAAGYYARNIKAYYEYQNGHNGG